MNMRHLPPRTAPHETQSGSSPRAWWRTALVSSLAAAISLAPLPSSQGLAPELAAKPVAAAAGERLKDIAHIRGVRANQLFGYGLVVGLNRTGDSQQVRFAMQTVASLLARLNVRIDPRGLLLRNIATVMVTAELPPFARNGNCLDVTVSSMGDAKSLSGGTLIATAMRGHDGNIYAMAQGPLAVGGYSIQASGGGGSKIQNHPTVARIPGGAIVEREINFELKDKELLTWQLFEDDFTTAVRAAQEINNHFGSQIAIATDSRSVQVKVPSFPEGDRFAQDGHVARFIAQLERVPVVPDASAKVIINERTGTVIINQDVRVDPVAITHGNLTVTIKTQNSVVPATAFTPGQSTTQSNTELSVEEESVNMIVLKGGQSLQDLVDGLNQLGASPRDIITILQSIQRAGALRAKVEVI
jgi:flagellar P-ring protein precursor FlgI